MPRNLLLGVVFAVLLGLVGLLLYLNFFAPLPEPGEPSGRPTPATMAGPSPPPPLPRTRPPALPDGAPGDQTAGRRMTVVLYFQSEESGLLLPEERQVEERTDANSRARIILEELLSGPTDGLPTIPEGTRVREVYFDSSGVAYVDFSRELRDNHGGGSAEELMTIDSVIHSLSRNLPQVQSVQFLIEGRPIATLTGHVDLTRPLYPSSDRLGGEP